MSAGAVTRPDLSGVTLVAASSVALDATADALVHSARQAQFAGALLFADCVPPAGVPDGVTWRQIAPLRSRQAYSRFMFSDLAPHIQTPHALVVQWDGFVIDSAAWDDAFLDYDYIGAPWTFFADRHVVGNGGFSLRSRRLLEALRHYRLGAGEAEDLAICRRLRPELEQRHAIRFAPPHVAERFSWERVTRKRASFGFHGVFNLAQLLEPVRLLHLLSGLEPETIHRNERREIVASLLRRGEFSIALRLWRHFMAQRSPRLAQRSA